MRVLRSESIFIPLVVLYLISFFSFSFLRRSPLLSNKSSYFHSFKTHFSGLSAQLVEHCQPSHILHTLAHKSFSSIATHRQPQLSSYVSGIVNSRNFHSAATGEKLFSHSNHVSNNFCFWYSGSTWNRQNITASIFAVCTLIINEELYKVLRSRCSVATMNLKCSKIRLLQFSQTSPTVFLNSPRDLSVDSSASIQKHADLVYSGSFRVTP